MSDNERNPGDAPDTIEITLGRGITFAELLDRLGHRLDETISLCSDRDGAFRCVSCTRVKWAPGVISPPENTIQGYASANCWFSINPVHDGLTRGRGKEGDTTRLAAVVPDLDFGEGKCGSNTVAIGVANDLAAVMGQPAAVTLSGHGLHPYWPIADGAIDDTFAHEHAKTLLDRFHALVAGIAARHGAKVDNVFDLARVLRVPGTVNIKPGMAPVPVVCYEGIGGPLTVGQVKRILDEHGIPEHPVKIRKEPTGGASTTSIREPWLTQGRMSSQVLSQVALAMDRSHRRSLRADDASRHGNIRDDVLALARLGKRSEPGVSGAIELLRAKFVSQIGPDRPGGEVEAAREFDSFCDSVRIDPLLDGVVPDGTLFEGHPIPLTSGVPVPPFPVDALPDWIADMVRGVAEATQTDLAMAGAVALVVLATCNGGCAQIEIRPQWHEPLVLHIVVVAAPGERKSAVLRLMTAPVYEAERRLVKEARDKRREAETRKHITTTAAERLRRDAATAEAGGDQRGKKRLRLVKDVPAEVAAAGVDPAEVAPTLVERAIAADRAADAIEVPVIPRLIADDITPEAAAEILAEQGGRLAIISAEGGIFDIIAGRYNLGKANLEVFLKGHSGDELRVDRKGGSPQYVSNAALTVGLMIQPLVLSSISANAEFRGRGLLARFLYARPPSMVGKRRIGKPIPPKVQNTYTTRIVELAKNMAAYAGKPITLRLDEAAIAALQAIELAIEPTLAEDGQLAALPDWGGKYVGGVIARVAANFHLARYGASAEMVKVDEQTIRAAARVGEYFRVNAINAFTAMGGDQVCADAAYLLDRILRLGRDEVSERDMFNESARGRFRTMADMAPALQRLVDHSYLAKLPAPTSTPSRGRHPSTRYKVHPAAAKYAQYAKTPTDDNSAYSAYSAYSARGFDAPGNAQPQADAAGAAPPGGPQQRPVGVSNISEASASNLAATGDVAGISADSSEPFNWQERLNAMRTDLLGRGANGQSSHQPNGGVPHPPDYPHPPQYEPPDGMGGGDG